MATLLIIAVSVVGGLLVLLLLAAVSGPLFDECGRCKDPMPNGYEAYHEGKRYCRRCASKLGLKSWYERTEMGEPRCN